MEALLFLLARGAPLRALFIQRRGVLLQAATGRHERRAAAALAAVALVAQQSRAEAAAVAALGRGPPTARRLPHSALQHLIEAEKTQKRDLAPLCGRGRLAAVVRGNERRAHALVQRAQRGEEQRRVEQRQVGVAAGHVLQQRAVDAVAQHQRVRAVLFQGKGKGGELRAVVCRAGAEVVGVRGRRPLKHPRLPGLEGSFCELRQLAVKALSGHAENVRGLQQRVYHAQLRGVDAVHALVVRERGLPVGKHADKHAVAGRVVGEGAKVARGSARRKIKGQAGCTGGQGEGAVARGFGVGGHRRRGGRGEDGARGVLHRRGGGEVIDQADETLRGGW